MNAKKEINDTVYQEELHKNANEFAEQEEKSTRNHSTNDKFLQDIVDQLADKCLEENRIGLTTQLEEVQIFNNATGDWEQVDLADSDANEKLMSANQIRVGGDFINQEGSIASGEYIELYNANAHLYDGNLIAMGTNDDGINVMISELDIATEIKRSIETGLTQSRDEEIIEPEL